MSEAAVEKAAASSEVEEVVAAESKTEEAVVEKKTEKSANSEKKAKGEEKKTFTVKDGRVAIVSKPRAGKKIIAKTGEIIEFDAEGKASVREEDASYLSAFNDVSFE